MNTDVNKLWAKCLTVIKDNISEKEFETWFKPIMPSKYDGTILSIFVPSQFFMEYLEENYVHLLRMTIERVVGSNTILQYEVLVETNTNTRVNYQKPIYAVPTSKTNVKDSQKISNPFEKITDDTFDSQLNIKYQFDNYFEGGSNLLARTAADSIVKSPGNNPFNPLFLHGTSGVGKTHLCHAIGNAIKKKMPEKKVLYVSAHLFKIQFADAGRYNTINDFVNFYQNIDVLIIDDIQELEGIEKTQRAFFHIFNHLHQNSKQLILTSDRSPSEMKDVQERLLSRFRWGLTALIKSPDEDLRIRILKDKVTKDGLSIPDDVIKYIAKNVTDNIRDLEGVIVSVMAHSVINNKEVDLSLTKRVIGQAIKVIEKKKITADLIQNVVCDYFEIEDSLLQSASRKREIVLARQIAMYLIKNHTDMSLAQIGTILGKRNHATVLHACKTMKEQIEVDKKVKMDISEIEKRLAR